MLPRRDSDWRNLKIVLKLDTKPSLAPSRQQQQQQATRLGAARRAATLGIKMGVSVNNVLYIVSTVLVTKEKL